MDTEKLLRKVVEKRSELELIYRTTTNEEKKSKCLTLMNFLENRQEGLEKELEKELKDLEELEKLDNDSWFVKMLKHIKK